MHARNEDKVRSSQRRIVEQSLKHRRNARHRDRTRSPDRAQHFARYEPRQQRDAAAVEHRAVEHRRVAEGGGEGKHADRGAVQTVPRIDLLKLARVGGQVLMAEPNRARRMGGAARILDHRHVGQRIDCHRLGFGLAQKCRERYGTLPAANPPGATRKRQQQALERGQNCRQPPYHQGRERCLASRGGHGVEQRGNIDRNHQLRRSLGQRPRQLRAVPLRRVVDHARARQKHAVVRGQVERYVGQEQPDPVALDDAARLEPGGDRARLRCNLSIAETAPEKVGERCRRVDSGAGEKHVGQAERRIRLALRGVLRKAITHRRKTIGSRRGPGRACVHRSCLPGRENGPFGDHRLAKLYAPRIAAVAPLRPVKGLFAVQLTTVG